MESAWIRAALQPKGDIGRFALYGTSASSKQNSELKISAMRGSMRLPLRTLWSIPKLGAWTGSPGKCKHLEHGEAENDEPDRGVRGEQGRLDKLAPQDDAQHSARHYCQ